jgi:hypothetical protein
MLCFNTGDATSAVLAPPYSTSVTANVWAVACNRSLELCLALANVTLVLPSQEELSYVTFMVRTPTEWCAGLRARAMQLHPRSVGSCSRTPQNLALFTLPQYTMLNSPSPALHNLAEFYTSELHMRVIEVSGGVKECLLTSM